MRKSVTKITQQLEQQLAAIPGLVNQLERKSSLSMRSIGTWLLETESVLKELNMPEVSKFSVKRGELATFIPTGSSKKKRRALFSLIAANPSSRRPVGMLPKTSRKTRTRGQPTSTALNTHLPKWPIPIRSEGRFYSIYTTNMAVLLATRTAKTHQYSNTYPPQQNRCPPFTGQTHRIRKFITKLSD